MALLCHNSPFSFANCPHYVTVFLPKLHIRRELTAQSKIWMHFFVSVFLKINENDVSNFRSEIRGNHFQALLIFLKRCTAKPVLPNYGVLSILSF